jgi:maltooligosyltrehalose trehalohydrolase
VEWRVWAPRADRVDLVLEGRLAPMERQPDGTWFAFASGMGAGARYSYRLDGGEHFPDPYSRFQPEGVHGASMVIDPAAFRWHDQGWAGLEPERQVIYECHTGTFTPEGTFDALAGKLEYLRQLGVTALELMPVAEFSGTRNWGYDGVDWFAPSRNYGGPDGLRRLVDAAHQRGLGVLLDVVYNHFGPEGNYLRQFSPEYFTSRYSTPWGDAVNYEGCAWARRLATDNVAYWLREFHIDGFRFDATFAILDDSPRHILQDLTLAARAANPKALLIAETNENDVKYLARDGYGFDAVWADDFHHVLRSALAGDNEGYYRDYAGTMDELARVINQGFLYEGQWSAHLGRPRGTPARDRPAWQFVYCIQNHDQVGNRAFGERLNHQLGPDLYRAASALLLLLPYTSLLFMGQEFGSGSPFQYFTDHSGELGKLVTEGRRREFAGHASFQGKIPDPQAEETFARSKLDWAEAEDSGISRLYQVCLRLRRVDPVLTAQDRFAMRAQPLGARQLEVRMPGRKLIVNFGDEPFIVGDAGRVLLDTNATEFGGPGSCGSAGQPAVGPRGAVLFAAG